MDICEECFNSEIIANHIKHEGELLSEYQECDSCSNESLYRMNEFSLQDSVQNIIRRFYEHEWQHGLVGSAEMMARPEGDDISLFLPGLKSLKEICFELFQIDYDEEKFFELLRDYETDGESEFDQDPDEETWLNIGCDWDGTDDILLDWDTFCHNVKHLARFFDHEGYNRTDELKKLRNTFSTLLKRQSSVLFRARKIDRPETVSEIENNPDKELGMAPPKLAGHNRFSPNGISYVYLSGDKQTALREIRINGNDAYGVGRFQIENLNLVDLRKETMKSILSNPFSEQYTSELICSSKYINNFIRDITTEVHEDDKFLDYIPTQIVSEYIWSLGYDGFIFDSSLCDGDNYVLFRDNYTFLDHELKT